MIASKTNVAPLSTVSVSPDTSLQDVSIITDGDYSSIWSDSLSGSATFTFTFDTPQVIDYIAIGGSNISKKDRIVITSLDPAELFSSDGDALFSSDGQQLFALSVNEIDDSTLGLDESRVIVYRPKLGESSEVTVTVYGGGQLVVSEIAMGEEYEIPKGEQSGYSRPWTVPNIQPRSSTGLDKSPINLSYESRALSCTLTIPNNIMADFDEYYEFVKFASSNTFYILEDDDKFHSYACFNGVPGMTQAHPSTRLLGSSTLQFNAFAKSNEALL